MTKPSHDTFRITLLGSGAPPPRLDRFGPSTLVEVGKEKFIFDAGRGAMQRLHQLGIPFGDITGMFLTHHHSDHVVGSRICGLPDGSAGPGANVMFRSRFGDRKGLDK